MQYRSSIIPFFVCLLFFFPLVSGCRHFISDMYQMVSLVSWTGDSLNSTQSLKYRIQCCNLGFSKSDPNSSSITLLQVIRMCLKVIHPPPSLMCPIFLLQDLLKESDHSFKKLLILRCNENSTHFFHKGLFLSSASGNQLKEIAPVLFSLYKMPFLLDVCQSDSYKEAYPSLQRKLCHYEENKSSSVKKLKSDSEKR